MGWLVKWTDSSWSAIGNSYIFELFFPLLLRRETLSRKINSCWEVFCVKQCLLLRGESGFHYSRAVSEQPAAPNPEVRMDGIGLWVGCNRVISFTALWQCLCSLQNVTIRLSLLGPWIHGKHIQFSAVRNMCLSEANVWLVFKQAGKQSAVCLYGCEVGGGRPSGGMCFSTLSLSLLQRWQNRSDGGGERVRAPSLPSAVFALSSIIQ